MTKEFADASDIEPRVMAFHTVNLNEVVAQGIGAYDVRICKFWIIFHPCEIFEIAAALGILGQNKKFICVAQRHCTAIAPERPHIDRADMTRKPVEAAVIPEQ